MWKLKDLYNSCNEVQAEINKKWVPSRPINYKHRSFLTKVKEAYMVFVGKTDCFIWPENQ